MRIEPHAGVFEQLVTQQPSSRRIRALIALAGALTACLAAIALADGPRAQAAADDRLPPAHSFSPSGLAAELENATGTVRVRILAARQQLMQAALDPSVQDLVESPQTYRPGRAERRFDRAINQLQQPSRRTLGSLDRIRDLVDQNGGEAISEDLAPAALIAKVPAASLSSIINSNHVQAVLLEQKDKPLLDHAVDATGADDWWAAGHTGGSGASDATTVDVATQGEAPDATHPAFSGVDVINVNGFTNNHGTHTAGIIVSQDGTYKGAAPGIDSLIGGSTARVLGFADTTGPGVSDPSEVINRSAGSSDSEDDERSPQDVLVDLFDIGYAASAGNENVDGTPTVGNIGRNMVSVAAYNDLNNTTSTDDVILGVSSRGPTPGGRKKPDLIAPGGSIQAPDSNWNNPPSNPDFTGMSGTSFSAPFVASGMALLEGAGVSDSAAQRAILINSARDWDGAATGITNGWTPGSQGSWQPEVGWGALDLTAALAGKDNYEISDVEEGSARFFAAPSTAGAKATLAFELRGTWDGYPQNGVSPVIFTTSDLDLSQYLVSNLAPVAPPSDPGHGGGPDAGDPNDTVEQVRAPAGNVDLIYKVSSESQIDGLAAEPFAIAATEPLDPLENPEVRPTSFGTDAAPTVSCSTPVVVTTNLVNDSADLDATGAEVTLQLPSGVGLTSGSQTQTVSGGDLVTAETSEQRSWTVQATASGTHQLTITGTGGTMGETFTSAETVTFTADCDPPTSSIVSGPDGPTSDPSPSFAFSSSEPGSSECSLDSGPFTACSSPYEPGPLADGPHTIAIRSIDGVGNTGPAAERAFVIDTVAPAASIDSGPQGPTKRERPEFTFSSEPGASFECSIGQGFESCESPAKLGPLDDGPFELRVRAIDAAGNESAAATRSFTVDTTISRAKLKGKKSQRQRPPKVRLKLTLTVGESADAKAKGKIKLPGRDAKLKPAKAELEAGEKLKLNLSPKKARDAKRVLAAIADGEKVTAKPSVRLRDLAGNKKKLKRGIRLR